MDSFKRISESEDPLEVLAAPMEAALIPLLSYWPDPWGCPSEQDRDGIYEKSDPTGLQAAAGTTNAHGVDCPDEVGRRHESDAELRDRFIAGIEIFSKDMVPLWPLPEEISAKIDRSDPQRQMVFRALMAKFPGLNPSVAISEFRKAHSYRSSWQTSGEINEILEDGRHCDREEFRAHDYLTRAVELGYRPPFGPAHLIRFGTGGAKKGKRSIKLSIARQIALGILRGERTTFHIEAKLARKTEPVRTGLCRVDKGELRKLADAIKSRVQRPWPQSIFHKHDHQRIYNFLKNVSDVYNRAYDSWLVNKSAEAHYLSIRITDAGEVLNKL